MLHQVLQTCQRGLPASEWPPMQLGWPAPANSRLLPVFCSTWGLSTSRWSLTASYPARTGRWKCRPVTAEASWRDSVIVDNRLVFFLRSSKMIHHGEIVLPSLRPGQTGWDVQPWVLHCRPLCLSSSVQVWWLHPVPEKWLWKFLQEAPHQDRITWRSLRLWPDMGSVADCLSASMCSLWASSTSTSSTVLEYLQIDKCVFTAI